MAGRCWRHAVYRGCVIVDARAYWHVFLFVYCIGIGFGDGMVCFMSVLSNY